MAKVELKQPIMEEIASLLDGAQAVVLVDYRGLSVEEDTKLRKSFREAGVTYKVYKNTYIKRMIAGTEFEPVADLLEGPTAIAVSKEDATAPARIIAQNQKEMENLKFKGGVVAGTYYDADMMAKIASIPSREVLLGRLLGSIQAPIGNFARVLKQIAEKKDETAA